MLNSNEIIDHLRKKGHRITSQREMILKLFLELPEGDHLSAENLQVVLLEQNIKISLATLYRTLKFLYTNGLLRELDFGEDHKHYELNISNKHHHHLICNKCNATIEFNDENLIDFAKKVATEQDNFHVSDYQFKIFGICMDCRTSNLS